MVEFGLKLEDNKVEIWSDKYIDYERLKNLIKNAKKKSENRAELQRRNPSAAARIAAAYEKERQKALLSDSNSALNKISEHCEDEGYGANLASPRSPTSTDSGDEASNGEKVLLLTGFDESSVSKYGSNDSKKNGGADTRMVRNESTSSLGSFFKGVTKGFQFSTYESKLQDALQEETLAVDKFSITIYQEVSIYRTKNCHN